MERKKLRQLLTSTCYDRAVPCTCTPERLQITLKIVSNIQVFLTQKDGELDEVVMTALAKGFRAQVRQLILTFDVVDADVALLHQFS